jgi:transposase
MVTAGLDLGDKYSYLCLIDTDTGEIVEESRLCTTPEAFRRRFGSEQQMRVAIEAGTHSPWVSRVLEECGHQVLVANPRKTRLIYGQGRKTDKLDALRSWPVLPEWTQSCSRRWSTGERHLTGAPGAHPLA